MNVEEIEKLKYEQAFSRLEEIVAAMGGASVPLDELMDLYEEGMRLSAHCEKLLKSYDARLEKVARKAVSGEGDGAESGEE